MNRKQLRERILVALNDDPTSPVFFDPDAVNATIDEGLEILSEEAPLLKRSYTLPRRQGQLLYALPGVGERIMSPYRLWLPDLHRRLEPVELTDLDARHEQWMTVSGTPWCWAPVDWRSFVVWPIPAAGGGWLQVDAYVWPEALVDDADEPRDLALSDHEALCVYGEIFGHLLQWDVARAADLYKTFMQRWGSVRSGADLDKMQARDYARSQRSSGDRQGADDDR